MRDLIIELFVALLVFCLFYWAIGALPLPAIIAQIAIVVLIVVACLWFLDILLGLAGRGRFWRRPQ